MKISEKMKINKTYQKPEIRIASYKFDIMLDVNISDSDVDDEAAKDRNSEDDFMESSKKDGYSLW